MNIYDELADICLVDRIKYGYELIFDDGSAVRCRSASEARKIAQAARDKIQKVVIGDTQYSLDYAFIEGAKACKSNQPYSCNPYGDYEEEKQMQWNYGHETYAEHPLMIEPHLGAAQGFR